MMMIYKLFCFSSGFSFLLPSHLQSKAVIFEPYRSTLKLLIHYEKYNHQIRVTFLSRLASQLDTYDYDLIITII